MTRGGDASRYLLPRGQCVLNAGASGAVVFPNASEKRVPLHARALAFSVKICASFGRLLRGSLRLTRSLRKNASFFMVVSFASNTFARPRACLTLCLILPALESAIRRTSFSLPRSEGYGAPKAPTSALGGQKGREIGRVRPRSTRRSLCLSFRGSRYRAAVYCGPGRKLPFSEMCHVPYIPQCTAGSGLFAA